MDKDIIMKKKNKMLQEINKLLNNIKNVQEEKKLYEKNHNLKKIKIYFYNFKNNRKTILCQFIYICLKKVNIISKMNSNKLIINI